MTITLPDTPRPQQIEWDPIDFGFAQEPVFGGEVTRIDRPGNRYGCTVTMPPMAQGDALDWIAQVRRGISEGVALRIPLLHGQEIGADTLVVDGAGQSGTSLDVRGGSAGAVLKRGWWLSIQSPGAVCLHQLGAATTLDGSGAGTLTLVEALRYPHADGVAVTVENPFVTGLVTGDPVRWQVPQSRLTQIQFTIKEVL